MGKGICEMTNNIILKRGDSSELMMTVGDKTVDLILTDPPYAGLEGIVKSKKFGYNEMKVFTKAFERVLKETGNLVIFTGLRDKFMWDKVLKMEGKFMLKGELILFYNGGMKVAKRFLTCHESALWYVKSANHYFDDERGMLEKDVYMTVRPRGTSRNSGYDYEHAPSEKLDITPKPLGMVQMLVEVLCHDEGRVLDMFMGSGTTGEAVVALGKGRSFRGFEIRQEVFAFAEERIKKAQKVGRLV